MTSAASPTRWRDRPGFPRALVAAVAGLGLTASLVTVGPQALAEPVPAADEHEQCRPDGLYRTPDVENIPYCDVYGEDGREALPNDLDRRVIGYFTSWRTGKTGQPEYLADDIPWDKISHINYAFAHVGQDNRISVGADSPDNAATGMTWDDLPSDPAYDYDGHFNQLNKFKKQNPGVKTLVAVGGWAETGGFFEADGSRNDSGGFYSTTTTPTGVNHAGIETFADSAVEFVREYGFDGVDIDYEYATSNNNAGNPDDFWIANPRRAQLWEGYEVLMKTLREKLDAASAEDGTYYQLTVAAPSSGWLLRGQETHQVVQYLDFLNMMSYDLHGSWNHFVGPNAALYDSGLDPEMGPVYNAYNGIGYLNTDWSYHYFRGAMQAGRINVGVPFYTRGWDNVQGGTNGLWGTAALPDQSDCPPGTGAGIGSQTPCGNGATGIANLWHDSDPLTQEAIPAGFNPIWHMRNLEEGITPDYLDAYGVEDELEGEFTRHWDDVTKNEWWWNPTTRTYVSGDADQTIQAKADYVVDNGIGGVMIWEMAGDYSFDAESGQYEMGDDLITQLHTTFSGAGGYGNTKAKTPAPEEVLDVDLEVHDFALGDNNYPINPDVTLTNNSDVDIPGGATITFDYGTSAPGTMGDQSGLGLRHVLNEHTGNNVGGLDGDFHRAELTVPSFESIPAGGEFTFALSWQLPIATPSNWRISFGGDTYAISADHPSQGVLTGDPGPDPDPTASPSPDPGPDPDPDPGDCAAPAWNSTSIYTGGNRVSHNGRQWEARWWTQNETPTPSEWGVWRDLGPC